MTIELFHVELWMCLLPVLGFFAGMGAALGGLIGGSDFDEANAVLRQFLEMARPSVEEIRGTRRDLTKRGLKLMDEPSRARPDIEQARAQLFAPTGGLSPSTQLAFEDALRILDERLVSTGNLRSSTSAFQAAQLGERTIAAELDRQLGIASTFGQLDLNMRTLDQNVLQLAAGFAGAETNALQMFGSGSDALAGGLAAEAGRQTLLARQVGGAFGGALDEGLSLAVAGGAGTPGGFSIEKMRSFFAPGARVAPGGLPPATTDMGLSFPPPFR